MHQYDLDREIARATGESLGRIARQGFSLVGAPQCSSDEREPLTVDWDDVDVRRRQQPVRRKA